MLILLLALVLECTWGALDGWFGAFYLLVVIHGLSLHFWLAVFTGDHCVRAFGLMFHTLLIQVNCFAEGALDQDFRAVVDVAWTVYLRHGAVAVVRAWYLFRSAVQRVFCGELVVLLQSFLGWAIFLDALHLEVIEVDHELLMQVPESFILLAQRTSSICICREQPINTRRTERGNFATGTLLR